jgi:hypothetical protein
VHACNGIALPLPYNKKFLKGLFGATNEVPPLSRRSRTATATQNIPALNAT